MLGEVTGRAAIHFPFCFLLLFVAFFLFLSFLSIFLLLIPHNLKIYNLREGPCFLDPPFQSRLIAIFSLLTRYNIKTLSLKDAFESNSYLRPIAWLIGRSTSHWLDQDIRRVSLAICQALGLPRARQGSPRRENESRRYVRSPTTRNQTESLLTWQCECGMFQTKNFFIIIEAWRSTYSNIMERRHLWHTI